MAQKKKLPKPRDFGLASFADLFARRVPIPGEQAGSHATFHAALMKDLAPTAPYEMVLAENLIAIEWDLVQHRRMRDEAIRALILAAIREAVLRKRRSEHREEESRALDAWRAAGKDPKKFERDPSQVAAAEAEGNDLALRAVDPDPAIQAQAQAEARGFGLNLLEVMGEAFGDGGLVIAYHEAKIEALERRRRGVRGDLDALQKMRPVEGSRADVLEAEVIES